MSTDMLIRIFFTGIISAALGIPLLLSKRQGSETDGKSRYLDHICSYLLPLFVIFIGGTALILYGRDAAAWTILSLCFGIFLHITLYYIILVPALPFLRRHFSARACAALWMIPNYLYFMEAGYMKLSRPRLVIQAPGRLVWTLFSIWILGALVFLLWKILSHLVFRFRILKGAYAPADPEILSVWKEEVNRSQIPGTGFRLVISPRVSSPLSVGLFKKSMRVVLPAHSYSRKDLALIFRHELVHIAREDSWSKFFLVFCTAMCWFNPLMWFAMRKSADDLELSCDETVLQNSDSAVRHRYAELLLKTAGDERGFTTCLSASANALRYRLKNIIHPEKKHSGALLVGLTVFFLCLTCGYVALATEEGTGEEIIFRSRDRELYSLSSVMPEENPYDTTYRCSDSAALCSYLASLDLYRLTGNYSFEDSGRRSTFIFDVPEGVFCVVLGDHTVKLVPLYEEKLSSDLYYLPEGVNWEYLDTLILPDPALKLSFEPSGYAGSRTLSASLLSLEKTEDGHTEVLKEFDPELYKSPSGAMGYEASEGTLDFSHPMLSGFTLEIQPLDSSAPASGSAASPASGRTVYVPVSVRSCTLTLADVPARYRITADLEGPHGSVYHAVFLFEFGGTEP